MPQPIDINTELGRIAAAERIAQIADRASLAAQARVAQDAVEERQHAESEVNETEQKGTEVDRDARRRESSSERQRKREEAEKKQRPDAATLPVIPNEGHDLDISI